MLVANNLLVTPAQYIEGELQADIKHEYVNGYIYAMSGASRNHNRLTISMVSALHRHLLGKSCEVFSTDMKVRIKTHSEDCFYYPDVMVSCHPSGEKYYECSPDLIIEVLSESTQRYDREGKFLNYQRLDSLQEYVLIHQERRLVEIYRRTNDWKPEYYDNIFNLMSVDFQLTVDELYADIRI